MTSGSIVECVPNFSEGKDRGRVKAIVRAMHVPGVSLLDWSADANQNRSVVTVAGTPEAVVESAIRGVSRAVELIDLTQQHGDHPRIGAADVIPFVPVRGISLAECAMLARQAGAAIAQRCAVPVYLYEAAATRPDRVDLEDVRRGQFEGLLRDSVRDAARRPDVGGPELHPRAGASAVGARRFLIAYNIFVQGDGGGNDISLVRAIAREIRDVKSGLEGVKAAGVVANGRAQVNMNVTDFERTPVSKVYAAICEMAGRHGARVTEGELIGLIPERAYEPDAEWVRQTVGFDPETKILERCLQNPQPWP